MSLKNKRLEKVKKGKKKTTFETLNFYVMCFRDFNSGASEGSEDAVSCSRISLFHETERLWWNSPDAAHCVTISTIDLAVTGWFMWDRMTVSCLLYPGRPCALSLPLEVKHKPFLHCHKWMSCTLHYGKWVIHTYHTIHSFREHLCLFIQMYLTVALTIYDVRISIFFTYYYSLHTTIIHMNI